MMGVIENNYQIPLSPPFPWKSLPFLAKKDSLSLDTPFYIHFVFRIASRCSPSDISMCYPFPLLSIYVIYVIKDEQEEAVTFTFWLYYYIYRKDKYWMKEADSLIDDRQTDKNERRHWKVLPVSFSLLYSRVWERGKCVSPFPISPCEI